MVTGPFMRSRSVRVTADQLSPRTRPDDAVRGEPHLLLERVGGLIGGVPEDPVHGAGVAEVEVLQQLVLRTLDELPRAAEPDGRLDRHAGGQLRPSLLPA